MIGVSAKRMPSYRKLQSMEENGEINVGGKLQNQPLISFMNEYPTYGSYQHGGLLPINASSDDRVVVLSSSIYKRNPYVIPGRLPTFQALCRLNDPKQ